MLRRVCFYAPTLLAFYNLKQRKLFLKLNQYENFKVTYGMINVIIYQRTKNDMSTCTICSRVFDIFNKNNAQNMTFRIKVVDFPEKMLYPKITKDETYQNS